MKVFAKEYGRDKEPRRAYIFLAIVTLALTLVGKRYDYSTSIHPNRAPTYPPRTNSGNLNMLNEIVTNLFMATYVLVNYACFDASFVRSPGWRPEASYYNMWASLFGAALCVVVMFVVSIEVGD
jgi:Amino acid permease